MKNIKRKIYKLFLYGKTCINYSREFNVQVAIFSFLAFLFHSDNLIGRIITNKKHKYVYDYLYNNTIEVHNKYKIDNNDSANITEDMPIWICWWQGEDKAPELVKLCIESIRQQSKNHEIIVITENNYNKYLELPIYIIEKFNDGRMCHANFADILRVALLAKYGGIWLDATIFMTHQFDSSIYNYKFCSNKRANQPTSLLLPAKCRWGTYYMASGKNCIIFRYIRDVFFEFWKKNNMVIDYGMIDYIFSLGYDLVPKIKELVDISPVSNEHIHYLLPDLNKPFNQVYFNKIIEDTNLHKLSHKIKFDTEVDGKDTYYKYILNLISKGECV